VNEHTANTENQETDKLCQDKAANKKIEYKTSENDKVEFLRL